jgi:ubiquinone/menaquinone biosynthesis C-methylase UbiE
MVLMKTQDVLKTASRRRATVPGAPVVPTRRKLAAPKQGYDQAAEYYDSWYWQKFWRANEFPLVLQAIRRRLPVSAILDIGVGTGAFFEYCEKSLTKTTRLVGVDISAEMLARASERLGDSVALIQADVQQELPLQTASFDIVTMMRVANHLSDLQTAISEVARVLKPGGAFIATDFADSFEYTCTSIPSPAAKIDIQSYRHPTVEWRTVLRHSFGKVAATAVRLGQLKNPHAGHVETKIAKLDSAIFQIIFATRR